MIDPNKKETLPISPSEVCNRAFQLMAAKQWGDAERLLVGNMAKTDDDVAVALYHSALGVLCKMRGEFKNAWRHYRRAEKLMPDDPALKIISARLLIEEFAEYDQAMKKARQVLDIAAENPVFAHQAYTTMGLAWTRKGNRAKALKMLASSMGDDFGGFVSAENIDLNLLEAVLRRGWSAPVCRDFLSRACSFAQATGEERYLRLFERLLDAFSAEHPSIVSEGGPAGEGGAQG